MKIGKAKRSFLLFFLCGYAVIAFALTDADLVRNIQKKIARFPQVASLPVKVQVQNGVASLAATVDSESQAQLLIAIATSLQGINDVDVTQLTLANQQPISSNTVIIGKIIGTYVHDQVFGADKDIDTLPISVEISQGRIFLRGVLDTKPQLVASIIIARKISHFMQIISILSVRAGAVHLP